MSYGASTQSKWVLTDRASISGDGPDANRPPHSGVAAVAGVVSPGRGVSVMGQSVPASMAAFSLACSMACSSSSSVDAGWLAMAPA